MPPLLNRDGRMQFASYSVIRDCICDFHRPIAEWFFKGYSLRLMYRESELMVEILLRLMDMGITALPVHDGLLVAEEYKETARDTMLTCFRETTGFEGVVTIDERS